MLSLFEHFRRSTHTSNELACPNCESCVVAPPTTKDSVVHQQLANMNKVYFNKTVVFTHLMYARSGRPLYGRFIVDDQKGVLIAEAIEEINNIAGLACSEDFLEMQDLCSSFGQPPQQRRRRQEMEPIFPSSSNAREMAKFRREFGYMGPIAVQFSRDLQLLPLLEEDKQWLVLNVGPSSDKYLAIAEHPSHFRR
ncbi:hypothetical protein DEO72_LG9g545 [Vigna unguiculata]|uniref:Uncharacterized protein n=1 Tax=Vigna unguiculata TaxID=3917 RepID=A0A4D6MY11_VIGUN|nr:hypothetical protein DEO72_LG9g545 [Vigna unguiculata]